MEYTFSWVYAKTPYWEIGNVILQKLQSEKWGAKAIERLARDLKAAVPDMKGFSFRNLKYMRQFAENYPDLAIGQQAVAQIPWGHNVILLDKADSLEKRLWYVQKAIEHGWSRNILPYASL